MRTRLATTTLVVAGVFVLGTGMVAGSTGYRRLAAASDSRVARLDIELRNREADIGRLTRELEAMRAQLGVSRLRALDATAESQRARQQLKATADELFRFEDRVAAQQRDLEALRTCLGGAMYALQAMADSDRYGAMQHLLAVDAPCREAYRLVVKAEDTTP